MSKEYVAVAQILVSMALLILVNELSVCGDLQRRDSVLHSSPELKEADLKFST